jgi:hypothetical protein
LYELTQRKFLKQITQFSEKMSTPHPCPILFCVDLISIENQPMVPVLKAMCEYEEGWHVPETSARLILSDINLNFCAYLTRVMNLIKNGSLSTTMQIFLCEQGQKLLDEIEKNALSSSNNIEIKESYISLRKHYVNEVEALSSSSSKSKTDLNRCELKNGKIVWLCKKHAEATNSKIITDDLKTVITQNSDRLQGKLLDDIQQIKIEIVDEQCKL